MTIIRILLFFVVSLSLIGLVHYYFWRKLVRNTKLGRPWRRFATWLIVALGLSVPSVMIAVHGLPFGLSPAAMFVPYVWMGTIMFLLLFLGVPEVVWLFYMSGTRWLKRRTVHSEQTLDEGRRLFFARIVAGCATIGTIGLSSASIGTAMMPVRVKRVEIELVHLPVAFDGYRIVQLSDLHIGLTLRRAWLEEIVEKVNALNADLIVITGDIVDGSPERLMPELAPLRSLRARNGVFAVTGNHEYYSDAIAWMPAFEELGLRVLRNERISITQNEASFDLIGVDDYNALGMAPGHGADLKTAMTGADKSRASVLLAHQPREIARAAEHRIGLVLSGHTHGGQIWPWNHFVILQQPYVSGLYAHNESTQIYVNQGTGYWGPPMRLGTDSEITEVVLRSPDSEKSL